MPDKYAGAETEANALLSALGFSKDDVQAYHEQYGVNLADKFTTEFRASKHNYHAGERFYDQKSHSYKFKAYISVNESYYKHLKSFVAERRTSAQANASGAGGKVGEFQAVGAMRRQQILAQLPPMQVNVVASTAAVPLEVPALPSLPTAAEIGARLTETSASVAEAAPPVAMIATEAATPVLVGSHLAQKYVDGKHAFEMQQAEKAYEAQEAQDRAKLPPFGNNEPLAPAPPFINPDHSEQGRKLTQPITTPVAPPNIATGTPPFSNHQPLPPPPPLVTPMHEQDRLSHVIMATFPGATTQESVKIKLENYLLNPTHPQGGDKARWFEAALGFTKSNIDELAKQIVFDPSKAVPTDSTPYGQKYEQVIPITGANGRQIDVLFVWITNPDNVTRLVTAPPTKK